MDIIPFWKDELTGKNIYKIKLTAKPINHQANNQLIEVLEKYFNTKKRFISITRGGTSKLKSIKIVEN